MIKHFLGVADFTNQELKDILSHACQLKEKFVNGDRDLCMAGKVMAMIFEKPSSRTRISFETLMYQMGGSVVYLKREDIGALGEREPVKDIMRVLNGMVDLVVVRTFAHDNLLEMIKYATIPVINALSDAMHPCQAVADVMTMQEKYGSVEGLKVVFVGDGNNVATSLGIACAKLGADYTMVGPKGYVDSAAGIDVIETEADSNGCKFNVMYDVNEAVKGADVIYTDTWTSMGCESEKERRIKDFTGYQVDSKLMTLAKPECIIMHCLPAYRGFEITDEVIESANSLVFRQAENRLHAQREIVRYLMTGEM